eukprot:scaffold50156_cov49-Phaeocystis_antarctica.AAC.1
MGLYQPRALCAVAPHRLPGLRGGEDVWRGFRAPPRAQSPRPAWVRGGLDLVQRRRFRAVG